MQVAWPACSAPERVQCPARYLILLKELARVRGLGPCTCPCAWHSIPAGRDIWLIV